MRAANMMLDHPAWRSTKDGTAYRPVVRRQGMVIAASPQPDGGYVVNAHPSIRRGLRVDVVDPQALRGPIELTDPLRHGGSVTRLANPDLWDALATAIMRQGVCAGQARALYRQFCRELGDEVRTSAGPTWMFPSPIAVLAAPDAEYVQLEMEFKRRPLQAAARAYLTHGAEWSQMDTTDLLAALQRVPRIGPRTAGVAIADTTNDYSFFPFADLALRTWAQRLSPTRAWPESGLEFAVAWRSLARDQLSEWTLLTLAWGARHARANGAPALTQAAI